MKNKIYFIGGLIAIISMLIIPNVTSYEEETIDSNEVYGTGWFVLSSPNIEGIEEGLNLGGMHDLNFTAKGVANMVCKPCASGTGWPRLQSLSGFNGSFGIPGFRFQFRQAGRKFEARA